jgi:uncharacterized protein (DUF2062 family)
LIKEEAIKPEETNARKASSIGLGLFFGILPIWGFQLLVGIPTAVLLRLNKVLFIAAANISIPPMIPAIIFFSYLMGLPFVDADPIPFDKLSTLTLENIHDNFIQYVIGAILLSTSTGLAGFSLSWVILSIYRKELDSTVSE